MPESQCTGISFVDSTPIRVCRSKGTRSNEVFKHMATTGKPTMGYFSIKYQSVHSAQFALFKLNSGFIGVCYQN